MATRVREVEGRATKAAETKQPLQPRCFEICPDGPKTARQMAAMFGALIADVRDGRISPGVCNAMSSAAARVLKTVELEHRYGTGAPGAPKVLTLA